MYLDIKDDRHVARKQKNPSPFEFAVFQFDGSEQNIWDRIVPSQERLPTQLLYKGGMGGQASIRGRGDRIPIGRDRIQNSGNWTNSTASR